jgi:hypothetical protein
MNPLDPILDQPQSIDYEELEPGATYPLANHEIAFLVDATTDLKDLTWPWTDQVYARAIRLRIVDPTIHDDLVPMVTRYFPGHQETILGSEGMIITKRIAAPMGSADDRSVLWMLECQAEGDRLLRLDVEIDWGEPLVQRMVDGLLVAQANPEGPRGIYAQRNADSTRVFGNPHGRPTSVVLSADGRATLSYYVLVNGIVEVPLILTLSDVGEQVAWSGFLALRDAERAFEISVEAWERSVRSGRLWTPDPRLNRALQAGRLATVRNLFRLRTGYAPADRRVTQAPALVRSLDSYDPVLSRNLLAHLRRVAERAQGAMPLLLPIRPKDPIEPGPAAAPGTAYLTALQEHLLRHPDPALLGEHYAAVTLVADGLVKLRVQAQQAGDAATLAVAGQGLRRAVPLATQQKDTANAARWESEACELERLAEAAGAPPAVEPIPLEQWSSQTGWQLNAGRPWSFADPWAGVVLAGDAVWTACGLQRRSGKLWVYPQRANPWRWWALLGLPCNGGTVSLVWDGTTLHSTQPVLSDKPVRLCSKIRALKTDELDFDLQFELSPVDAEGASAEKRIFRPSFDAA